MAKNRNANFLDSFDLWVMNFLGPVAWCRYFLCKWL